jgi:putative transposase
LDAYANCFVRRHRPSRNVEPQSPPAATRGPGLALRNLTARKAHDKERG